MELLVDRKLFTFMDKELPTNLSSNFVKSEDVLVYENPTPIGDSKNSKLASAGQVLEDH